jgi:hypothetical protein
MKKSQNVLVWLRKLVLALSRVAQLAVASKRWSDNAVHLEKIM